MTRFNNILACADFSMPSDFALARAAWVAQAEGARLTLIHVLKRGALDRLHDLLAPDSDESLRRALVDRDRQFLHDRLAGTRVVLLPDPKGS